MMSFEKMIEYYSKIQDDKSKLIEITNSENKYHDENKK